MADCDIYECDGDHLLSYTCNECGDTFCTEHRLPESHNCGALRMSSSGDDEQRLATGLQDKHGKKRGLTKRDDSSETDSASPSSSRSVDSQDGSDKPYDTDRGWRSRGTSGETSDTDSGDSSPEPMDLDESQTVGAAAEREGRPSPDVARDGSMKRTDSTTASTTFNSRAGGRLRTWGVGLLTTASSAVSERVRKIAAWLWHVLTGIARLSGAALTLWGLGWIAVNELPAVVAKQYPEAIPGSQPVLVLLVGIILVQATKGTGH